MIEIKKCRLCQNKDLKKIVSLGNMSLSGVFPLSKDDIPPSGPLDLVMCSHSNNSCGLVQMAQSYNPDDMYNSGYGYKSSLNHSMVKHLNNKIAEIEKKVEFNEGDMVIDIGSNDGTSLLAYSQKNIIKVGIDPVGKKFKSIYDENNFILIDRFFEDGIKKNLPKSKAKVITSFSMFYDLPDPLGFSQTISEILHEDGIWVMEQSYLPLMIEKNSFDTICHEHLEFYSLHQIDWIAKQVGLKIIDCNFNSINGGSFSVTLSKNQLQYEDNSEKINSILLEESKNVFNAEYYFEFDKRIQELKSNAIALLETLKKDGKKICGIGASTKGNILLQYYGIDERYLDCILDVNIEKDGSVTPGTNIPIVDESIDNINKYDCFFVLIWHFKDHLIKNKKFEGKKLIFPLPNLEYIDL